MVELAAAGSKGAADGAYGSTERVMDSVVTPNMRHHRGNDGDAPMCTNESPVVFRGEGERWTPIRWNGDDWGRMPGWTGSQIMCRHCGGRLERL